MRVTKVKPSKNAAPHRASQSRAPTQKTSKPEPAKPPKASSRAVPLAVSEKPAVKRASPQPVEPAANTLDGHVSFHMRRAYQRTCTIFAEVLGRHDLTPTLYSAIARIEEMGPMSQSRLERETALEQGELLNVVGRLVRRGFIRPRPAPLDPRTIQLELTAEALAIMAELKAGIATVNARILAPLSPAEAKTLRELLERCG